MDIYVTREAYDYLNVRQGCKSSPCPMRQNDRVTRWRDVRHLYDAAYVVLSRCIDVEHARTLMGSPDGNLPVAVEDVPSEFAREAERRGGEYHRNREDKVFVQARLFQIALTTMARDIFRLTRMSVLQHDRIGFFRLCNDPVQSAGYRVRGVILSDFCLTFMRGKL